MRSRVLQMTACVLLSSAMLTVGVLGAKRPSVAGEGQASSAPSAHKLIPPPGNKPMQVAFVLTDGATVIDFAGPWEVFQDAGGPDGVDHFHLFTVGATKNPVRASGGMMIVPDYTFDDAPAAQIVVIPAQRGDPKLANWLRLRDKDADVVMSVCTGAFQLGKAGLLDGKQATTHHNFYEQFEKQFPKATLVKDRRYVQSDAVIYTAGGLTSGIDLALHVLVEYFDRDFAQKTADYMEYQSTSW